MTISEKVAYIKGLAEGMNMDSTTNEGKVTLAILDVLQDMALTLEDYDDTFEEMAEVVSDIEEIVYELEDEIFGDEDINFDEYDDFEDDVYEITCSNCDKTITVDFDVIEQGSLSCPNCGELIEFDVEFLDREDCDCGCGHDL